MTWLSTNVGYVGELFLAHLLLVLPAIAISILFAIPFGRIAYKTRWLGRLVTASASIVFAIPALALLILIPLIFPIPLRSPANVVTALGAYGIALMVRSVIDGFNAVDKASIDSAVALGYSRPQVLWNVELPLALPIIAAGLRVVSVSTVSMVTIGALIGVRSLGSLLTDGLQREIVVEIIVGLVLTVVLALLLDLLIVGVSRLLTPWARPR